MPQAAKTYESLAREAADNNLDYEEYLLCVLEQEVHQRENNLCFVNRKCNKMTSKMQHPVNPINRRLWNL